MAKLLMKLLGFAAVLALLTGASTASAQSTAQPVVPGYLTTTSCPTGQTTCFIAYGANSPPVIPDPAVPTGYQQFTSLATATNFTPPALTTFCVITAEGAALRFRTGGTAATASVGVPLAVGQAAAFRMSIANLSAISIIQQASGGIANVDCYRDS